MNPTDRLSLDAAAPTQALGQASQTAQERALSALVGLRGDSEGHELWNEACHRADVDAEGILSLSDLESVAEELSALEGPIALVGNSLSIRVHTYRMLARTQLLSDFLGTETP